MAPVTASDPRRSLFPSRIGSSVLGSAMLVAGGLALALVVGFGVDRDWGWATAVAVLVGALGYHLHQVLRLGRWLERGGKEPPAIGLWDEMHGLVARATREGHRREVDLAIAIDEPKRLQAKSDLWDMAEQFGIPTVRFWLHDMEQRRTEQ